MTQTPRQPLTDTQLRASPPQVALDSASLAALESITAVVSGAIELGATTLAALETIGLDASTLSALETTDLGATTLAALENITATISGEVSLDAGTLAALETIGLDAGTLAALETIELGATTLAALESITVVDGGGSLTVDGPATDAQLRATPLPVSGTVTASGPLTDTQLRASAVSVEQATSVTVDAGTGPFPVSDNAGSLTVDSPGLPVALDGSSLKVKEQSPLTQPLTDAQLAARLPLSVEQATSVDVVGPMTDTEFSAHLTPTTASGTITASAQTVVLTVPAGFQSWSFIGSGTWAGSVLQFEGSTDGGTTYAPTEMVPLAAHPPVGATAATGFASVTQQYVGGCGGLTHVRIRCSTFTGGDSVAVGLRALQGAQSLSAVVTGMVALAAGTNVFGKAGIVNWPSGTAVVTNVAASATSVTLSASDSNRIGLFIQNDGTSTLYVKLGTTATATTSYSAKLAPGAFWELPGTPHYYGRVDGIWTATGGNGALITVLTT